MSSSRLGPVTGTAGESFLLAQFREFYQEVVRWKRLASREGEALPVGAAAVSMAPAVTVLGGPVTAGGAGALMVLPAPAPVSPPPVVAPSAVWQALVGLLNRQEAEVRRSGGEYATAIYRRAQYVMAALADEIFLYLEWPGRDAWRTQLLEFKLFQSYNAGEEVFRRIEAVLRTRDPADAELAKIYLMALALGFRGALRGPGAQARIDWYRRELYTFLTNRDPGTPRDPHSLFPEAYQSNLETAGSARRLSPARRWLLLSLLLLLLWILSSQWVWNGIVENLWPLIDKINGVG
ncbi:MAG TPA: DotU family type IV/VI secretion system protein [Thermoanaerobaculia bacterium]|jgi:type VI secretion system protein ImpK|nr:DotU family type IV/VI secretion system protein [Thermoanaerobaculia bacterium]